MKRLVVIAAWLVACSSKRPEAVVGANDSGSAVEDAGSPPIDPKKFDCTSLAKGPPARVSPTSPDCLRDPTCKTRLVAGHRGAGGDLGRIAPEDTLSAYRAAIVMGADLVETDPRPTKDGVIVNIHDTTLDRTTSGSGKVDEKTLAEIRAMSVKTKELPGDFSCDRVPTLEEILTLCKGKALVLVDANKTDRVDLLVAAIQKADAREWAVFDTSQIDKIDRALAIDPTLLIMPRIHDASEAAAIIAKFGARPVFYEIAESVFPKTADLVHAAGSRVFTDVFITDIGVKLDGKISRYLDVYAKGAEALQTDLPDLVLESIGRRPPP